MDAAVEELGGLALPLDELRRRPPAVARLALRRAAEAASAAAGREPGVALSRADADAVLGAGAGGTRSYDLGGGLRCVVEYGVARFTYEGADEPPEPVRLSVPGAVRFGGWEVEARLGTGGEAVVDAGAIGGQAVVRGWRDGDRMRPAGLGGTKTLQDLFTDRKVPRELRRTLPLVEVDGEIAWVAGVALGERFSAGRRRRGEPHGAASRPLTRGSAAEQDARRGRTSTVARAVRPAGAQPQANGPGGRERPAGTRQEAHQNALRPRALGFRHGPAQSGPAAA